MAGWTRRAIGDIPIHQATTLSWLPGVIQGFTTRSGGVSVSPYETFNLAAHVGDDPAAVATNRERLWADLGFRAEDVAMAEQVHGDGIARVTHGGGPPVAGVDALVTDVPGILLMMFYADCVPVYVVDPARRTIALIHAGWRGTESNIVGKTVAFLRREFRTVPSGCLAAIGPSISGDSYEVQSDVADRFRDLAAGGNSGASTVVVPKDELGGKYLLNLRQVIFTQLLAAGIRAESVAGSQSDTYRDRREFFSYRRDGQRTGRMCAFLGMRAALPGPER